MRKRRRKASAFRQRRATKTGGEKGGERREMQITRAEKKEHEERMGRKRETKGDERRKYDSLHAEDKRINESHIVCGPSLKT